MRAPLIVKITVPVCLFFLILAGGFVAWAKQGYQADAEKLAAARSLENVVITDSAEYIWIKPQEVSGGGYIFYPGARIDSHAYLWKLSEIAQQTKMQIFITKPRLNLAIFGVQQAGIVRESFPEITKWYVGGHSLGGVMACFYAKENQDLAGMILMGSYCSTDNSAHPGRFLSISGGRDNLTSAKSIQENRKNLPVDARLQEIPAMNHAQFGNYGTQKGDMPVAIGDDEVKESLNAVFRQFIISQN